MSYIYRKTLMHNNGSKNPVNLIKGFQLISHERAFKCFH